MKLLLLPAFCFCTFIAFGQTQENSEKQLDLLKRFKSDDATNDSLAKLFQNYLRKQEYTIDLSSKQNSVVTLPQDNMPCIIPDNTQIASIPNGWSGKTTVPYRPQYHPIPNPGLTPNTFRYRVSDSWSYPVPESK